MDTAQWPQEMVVKPMDEIITNQSSKSPSSSLERKTKPQRDQVVNCPRCNSTNTKFCYYNNYSLSQPRYFCKTCRRYWTAGGSLRNIPVGGGSRKNKRSSSSSSNSNSSSSSSLSSKRVHDHLGTNGGFIGGGSITAANNVSSQLSQNPKNNIHGGQDLNLCFPPQPPPPSSSSDHFKTFTELIQVPNYDNHNTSNVELNNNPSCSSSASASASVTPSSQLSAMELLTGMTSRGLNSFMPMPSIVDPNTMYSSGFSLSEPKNSLNFSLDGLGNGGLFGGLQSVQDQTNNGRLFFPFEDLKQVSNTANANANVANDEDAQQNIDQNGADSTGYWNGVLGGGNW